MTNKKNVAPYLRLSLEDERGVESNSIINQRKLIMDFIASSPDFADMQITEYVDDGYSGTNFDRPGIKQLFEAVRRGDVTCIIVKDLSRFGRKYLEVCKYIEQIFPCLGIRFIAINDHYDSNNHKGTTADIDVPVRNMINAMYSRDVSRKVKSAKQTQVRQGKCINAFALYGYKKDEADKHRLVIDESAAKVVRRIFELACDGLKPTQIAKALNADRVLTPSEHKKKNGSNMKVKSSVTGSIWSAHTIIRILRDEQYIGTLVACKVEAGELGSGKYIRKSKEDWIRIPNAHPAIVTQEIWNTANEMKGKYGGLHGTPNTNRILYKRVLCGYCGHVMEYKDGRYGCKMPRYTNEYGCQQVRYSEHDIVNVVRKVVKHQIAVMLDMEKLSREKRKIASKAAVSLQETVSRIDREILQLQVSKRQLYERFKGGMTDKSVYHYERGNIEIDINAKVTQREVLLSKSNAQTDSISYAHDFFSKFLQHQVCAEPSSETINALVEAVLVYDKDRIEICFTFKDEVEQAIQCMK